MEKITPAEWQKCVEKMSEATRRPVNGEIKALNRSTAVFERRHRFNSETMRQRVFNEEIDETRGICEWLMQLKRGIVLSICLLSRGHAPDNSTIDTSTEP